MRVYSKAQDKKKPQKPKVARSPRPAAKPLTPPERAVSAHVAETFGALGAAVHDPKVQAALGAGLINTATDRFPWEVFDQKINAIAGPLEEIVRRSLVIPHLMPKAVVIQTNFNHLDPRVALAARTQASKLAASMASEQYAKVRTIIGNGVAKGDTSRQIARQLRAHIGLNARQDRQMATVRLDATQAAIDAGLTGDAIDASVAAQTDSLWTKMINYRADMIARTETMAAQNQGLMLGIQQSYEDPQSSVDNTYLKRWIATDDERTCETCGAVDGDEVPLDENFQLDDGTEIGYPLEDGSSPHPNCRCTVGLVPPDRSVSDLIDQSASVDTGQGDQMAMDFASALAPSQEVIQAALRLFLKEFNPDEPRDDHGKWTSDGGGGSAGKVELTGRSFTGDQEKQGRAFLQKEQVFSHPLDKPMMQAVAQYQAAGNDFINSQLRSGTVGPSMINDNLLTDAAISRASFTQDVIAYRGVGDDTGQFAALKVGDTFTDKAYSSTTLNPMIAEVFAAQSDMWSGNAPATMMQVHIPAGYPAIAADQVSEKVYGPDISNINDESVVEATGGATYMNEVTLMRNTTFEVLGRTVSAEGTPMIQVRPLTWQDAAARK